VLEGVDDTVPFIARMIGIDAYTMSDADWQKVQAKLKDLTKQLRSFRATTRHSRKDSHPGSSWQR